MADPNGKNQKSLFFVSLPEFRKLCTVRISFSSNSSNNDIRSKQMKICRELVLLFPGILVSPGQETCSELITIMSTQFFKTGNMQAYTQRHEVQMDSPKRVFPGELQTCLTYTLIARLAPNWNKAGHLLIQGVNFMTESGKQNAIDMELNVTETQLCISVEVNTIRLPPAKMEDFDIFVNSLRDFMNDRNSEIPEFSLSNNWCYVLPSLKMGQIMKISHTFSPECPFQSYEEIKLHWDNLYGYKLPQNEEIYCNVYFKLIGEKLFTYPLSVSQCRPFSLTHNTFDKTFLTQLPYNYLDYPSGNKTVKPYTQPMQCSSQPPPKSTVECTSNYVCRSQSEERRITPRFDLSTAFFYRAKSRMIPVFHTNAYQKTPDDTKFLLEKKETVSLETSSQTKSTFSEENKRCRPHLQRPHSYAKPANIPLKLSTKCLQNANIYSSSCSSCDERASVIMTQGHSTLSIHSDLQTSKDKSKDTGGS
ncbi:uncharacterized protein C18orf63 [Erpetoichthys calabaricus]|uniref:uncharacterized protein C18orf63 n=1 Tax=Erpetoichthys calabaricus TaxID=27687 RepID=UPI00223464FF|nr:uncharacterized protein C18orf63 [Erpetoichthys calabaricus]